MEIADEYIEGMASEKNRGNAGGNLPDLAPGIEVRVDPERQGWGVFAAAEFPAGARLGFFTGQVSPRRSRMSLQFGRDLFIEPGPDDPFRNLNHACYPSARFVGRNLHATRDLHVGEAITIDYSLHEDELASPFPCKCGEVGCMEMVGGWNSLPDALKQKRLNHAGEWLFLKT